MHKQAECSTTLVIAFISPHLSTKKNMETNYHIWMTRLWIWQDNSNRIQQTGKEVRNTFMQGHREPRSAAIWSGEIPPLSALFASAPWLRRRLTTAVDPVPCTAKTRERDPLQLGHWQVGLHVWGPRVRDTTAGHSTAADLVPKTRGVAPNKRMNGKHFIRNKNISSLLTNEMIYDHESTYQKHIRTCTSM